GVVGQIAKELAQIFKIDQSLSIGRSDFGIVIGEPEGDIDDAFLDIVKIENARNQKRPHLENGGANRVTLLAKEIPEHHRKLFGLVVKTHVFGALDQLRFNFAAHGNAREIAFDVGGKNRDTGSRESFGKDLQRHRLAGAGCASGEAMAIGERERKELIVVALADKDHAVAVRTTHVVFPSSNSASAGRNVVARRNSRRAMVNTARLYPSLDRHCAIACVQYKMRPNASWRNPRPVGEHPFA